MSESQSSYRQIMKSTAIFGGVQVFNILISILKSKLIAVLLGPAGMGITGLFNSTLELINNFVNFGLSTSAVKEVAAANSHEDDIKVSNVIISVKRIVFLTGLLGALLVFIFSKKLSLLTFNSLDYTNSFRWISISVLFTQVTSGNLVVLQGLRKIQFLATANMIGAVLGLIFSTAFYYLLGVEGIVYSIIITSVTTLSLSWFYARKVKIIKEGFSNTLFISQSHEMLKMGGLLSVSGLLTLGTYHIIRIYLSKAGGIEEVGFYNAGFAIINSYVGIVFTAMGTDYFPRLSAIAHDNKLARLTINQQAEITVLILAPILTVLLSIMKWAIVLLYSSKFAVLDGMLQWVVLGMFFKAAMWPIGFIFLAKSDAKVFFISEVLSNSYLLAFSYFGYKLFGLEGLGISFLLTYMLSLMQVFLIARFRYQFLFGKHFLFLFALLFLICLACFLSNRFLMSPYNYIIEFCLVVISVLFSFKELDKRLNLKSMVLKIVKRK